VQNELRHSYDHRPYGTVRGDILSRRFLAGAAVQLARHRLAQTPLQPRDRDVLNFFSWPIRSQQSTINPRGAITPSQARQLAGELFAASRGGTGANRNTHATFTLAPRLSTMEDRVQLPRGHDALAHGGLSFADDDAALSVLADQSCGRRSSRLYSGCLRDADRDACERLRGPLKMTQPADLRDRAARPRPERLPARESTLNPHSRRHRATRVKWQAGEDQTEAQFLVSMETCWEVADHLTVPVFRLHSGLFHQDLDRYRRVHAGGRAVAWRGQYIASAHRVVLSVVPQQTRARGDAGSPPEDGHDGSGLPACLT